MEKIENKLSIITICYNCASDLERTIKSVLIQTYSTIEYIIVDGGSTDRTPQILDKYKDRIEYIISEPDDGIYDALNKGIRRATGEWILCLNAGDVLRNSHIITDVFSNEIPHHISFLYSDYVLTYENGKTETRPCDRSKGVIHHQNSIYRRNLHETYGYYIVTHPYIVSDLLFFLAIPENLFMKIDTIMTNVQFGGVSNGQWCTLQRWAAHIIYGKETFPSVFGKYALMQIKNLVKRILLKH
jgi:glycosyltransferase involved in cell wall biosynthesis